MGWNYIYFVLIALQALALLICVGIFQSKRIEEIHNENNLNRYFILTSTFKATDLAGVEFTLSPVNSGFIPCW